MDNEYQNTDIQNDEEEVPEVTVSFKLTENVLFS